MPGVQKKGRGGIEVIIGMKRRILLFILFAIAVISMLFFFAQKQKNDATIVTNLPSGFVEINRVSIIADKTLRYVFWEEQVSFMNGQGVCVYQASVNDRDFIVKYKDGYWIYESVLIEAYQRQIEPLL